MTRRELLKSAAGVAAAAPLARAQQNRPNIIWIMADDLGYGDLGCYGQKKIKTPHIDKLAAEGMRFTQAYAGSSVCAPSRSALMTGLHNGHGRVRDNIPHGVFLRPDDFTVAELLKQAGYATAGFGKWSLGNPGSWGVARYQGFDRYFGHLNQDQAHQYYPDYLWDDDEIRLLMRNRQDQHNQYSADLFAEEALKFIDAHREDPFFLYFATTLPHFSDFREGPDKLIVPTDAPYTDEDWPQLEKNYAAMITRLDDHVGQIVAKVREHGLEENTLIVFTSDNGPWGGHDVHFFDSAGPLRGKKRDMYEGGVRVPLIARWKGHVAAGSTTDHICAFWDFLPTAAEMTGLPTPEGLDGISFLPTLLGQPQREHEYLYWDYGHVREAFLQGAREGKWKAVRNGRDQPIELYDLENDIGETRNVFDSHPDVVRRMEQIFAEAYEPSADYPVPE